MDEFAQKRSVHLLHIAHETIVHLLYRTLCGTDHVHVRTRQAERIHASCLQTGHYVLVHQSAIHHCHHLQSLGIGDAASIHHFAFNTQQGCDFRCRTSAAVHQDFISFDGGKVIQQLAEGGFLFHDFATHLDYSQFLSHYSKYVYPYKPER